MSVGNGINKMNTKWLLLVITAIASMGWWVYAADSADSMEGIDGLGAQVMDYMDPFDLSITRYVVTASSVSGTEAITLNQIPGNPAGGGIAQPSAAVVTPPVCLIRPMVRVPYKPPFRSPCQP